MRPLRDLAFPAACAAALLAFALAYSNSLGSPFHFDDDHVIQRNPHLRQLSNLPRFFTDARTFSVLPQNATYRPLVSATLAVDHRIAGGLSPRVFHLTQLALFLAAGVLLFFVARALLQDAAGPAPWHRWGALLAAALFCLHTANTQPANYISARSELLCALGVLGALLLYLRAPRLRPTQLFLLPMAAGALAKTPAVIAAPLLLTWRLLAPREEGRGRGAHLLRAGLFCLPAFAAAAALFVLVESMNPAGQTYGGGPRLRYLWTQAGVWVRYLRLFVLPTGLSADTDLALLPSPLDVRVFAGAALLGLSLIAAWLLRRRAAWRPAALGLVWFWLGVLPTSSLFPLAEVTNDHRMFLGYLGLCLAAGTLAAERLHALGQAWPRARALGAAACVVILCAHAVATHVRNRAWQSEEALWADVVEKSPKNGRGWMNYGLTVMRQGDLARAKALFDHAATLTPSYGVLEVNRGVLNGALGDAAAAEGHFRRALALTPEQAAPHHFFGRWLVDQGRAREALPLLERAGQLDFGDPAPRRLRLWIAVARADDASVRELAAELQTLGEDGEARTFLAGAHPLVAGDDARLFLATGHAELAAKKYVQSAVSYRAALAKDPSLGGAWNDLGWSLLQLGFPEDAVEPFERAVALVPGDPRPANNLAQAQRLAAERRERSTLRAGGL